MRLQVLVALCLVVGLPTLAAEVVETFDHPADYVFDPALVEIAGGTAALKDGSTDAVGYWRFEESSWSGAPGEVFDDSGNGLHGTAEGGASVSTDGLLGNAASFSGGYVNLGSSPELDFFPGTDAFTVAAWFRATGNGALVAKAAGNTGGRQFYLFLLNGRLWGTVGGVQNNGSTAGLDDGQWHHAALVSTPVAGGNPTYTLYVDGAPDGTFTGGTNTNTADVLVGARRNTGNTGSAFGLNGSVDEVTIVDRALSAGEIASLHNGGAGRVLAGGFPTSGPSVTPVTGLSLAGFDYFSGFEEIPGAGHSGDLAYQLSADGADWRFWNGSSWVVAGPDDHNAASEVEANLWAFEVPNETLFIRTFLLSDGATPAVIDGVRVTYEAVPVAPGRLTVVQSVQPADGPSFSYQVSPSPDFTLSHGESQLLADLGTYVVRQSPSPFGWALDRIECGGEVEGSTAISSFDGASAYDFASSEIAVEGGVARLRLDAVAADRLSHWPLDEASFDGLPGEVLDVSGNGFDGTSTGTPVSTSGILGGAASFDGVDDALVLGGPDLAPTEEYSVALWFRTDGDGALIGKADGNFNQRQFYLFTLQGRLWGAVGGSQNAGPSGVSDGAWHHAALVNRNVGGSFRYTLYLDGVAAADFASGTATNAFDVLVGARRATGNSGLAFLLDGEVDEVVTVGRALDDAEVAGLYNGGSGRLLGGYPQNGPTILGPVGPAVAGLQGYTGFGAIPGPSHEGNLGYSLSVDGIHWQFWDGSAWSAAGPADYNDPLTVDTHIGELAPGSDGRLYLRAHLLSDGSQRVELDAVEVTYLADPSAAATTVSGDTLTVEMVSELEITCTFYNVPRTGSITLALEGGPADGTDVPIQGNAPLIVLDNASPDDGDGVAGSAVLAGLTAGTYHFYPDLPDGYGIDDFFCRGLPKTETFEETFDDPSGVVFDPAQVSVSDGRVSLVEDPLTQGLSAYWQMDEAGWTGSPGEIRDTTSPSGLVGRAFAGADTVPGFLGSAGGFSGGSYAGFGAPAALDFDPATDSFSVSAWFRTSSDGALLGKAVGNLGQRQYYLFTYQGRLWANVGGRQYDGARFVNDGQWHHVALAVADQRFELFLDGNSLGSFDAGTGRNTADFLLGARRVADNTGTAFALDGELDEVAVWNRELSVGEIARLWNQGSGQTMRRYSATAQVFAFGGFQVPSSEVSGGELVEFVEENLVGEVRYQLTRPSLSGHYFWDGTAWTEASGPGDSNTAAEIRGAQPFDLGFGRLDLRAFLVSDGWAPAQLDGLALDWQYEPFVDNEAQAGVYLAPEVDVLCTLTLGPTDLTKGSLTLRLDAAPADDTLFYIYDLSADDTLVLSESNGPSPKQWLLQDLDPGVYGFSLPGEFVGPWQFTDFRCSGNASPEEYRVEEVRVGVDAGETVVCDLIWRPIRVPRYEQVTDEEADHAAFFVAEGGDLLARVMDTSGNDPLDSLLFDVFLDEAGQGTRRLTQSAFPPYESTTDRGLEISADGRYLAYEAFWDPLGTNADGNSEIFLLDLETDALVQVTETTGCRNVRPRPSGGGIGVAFLSDCTDLLPAQNPDGNLEPFVWYDGVLVPAPETSGCEAWELEASSDPMGSFVTFVSSCDYLGTNADLEEEVFQWNWIQDTLVQVTFADPALGERTYGLAASDDGRHVFFVGNRNYTSAFDVGSLDTIHRWDRLTGNYLPLLSWGFPDNVFALSADATGHGLMVSRGDSRSWLYWEISDNDSTPLPASRTTIFDTYDLWSPQVVTTPSGVPEIYFATVYDPETGVSGNTEIYKVVLE